MYKSWYVDWPISAGFNPQINVVSSLFARCVRSHHHLKMFSSFFKQCMMLSTTKMRFLIFNIFLICKFLSIFSSIITSKRYAKLQKCSVFQDFVGKINFKSKIFSWIIPTCNFNNSQKSQKNSCKLLGISKLMVLPIGFHVKWTAANFESQKCNFALFSSSKVWI